VSDLNLKGSLNLTLFFYCKKAFSQEQVDTLRKECFKRKNEKKMVLYVALAVIGGLVVSVGLFVVIDLQLYKGWF